MFNIKQTDVNAIVISQNIKKGFEQWYLLQGDQHVDHPDCDKKLLKKHLDQAIERKAGIISVGDLFDVMQSRGDKRANKSSLSSKYAINNYIDAVVDDTANFLEPYAKNIVFLARGNHCTSVLKNLETDIMGRLSQVIGYKTKIRPIVMGYTGWIKFNFANMTAKGVKGKAKSFKLWYNHGSGAGKGLTSIEKEFGYIDADIFLSGHHHRTFYTEAKKLKLTERGAIKQSRITYVKTPSYKDSYKTGNEGWEVEKGLPPQMLGAWWLRFFCNGSYKMDYEFVRAT